MQSTFPQQRTKPRIRPATLSDKDGYVRALLAGYELDHQFIWRYPRRHEFPEDARDATGVNFEKAIESEKCNVLVAELPKIKEDGKESEEWLIVAGVVWEWKFLEEVVGEVAPSGFSPPTSTRRDMDPHRQGLFIDAIIAAEKHHLGPEWGTKRLELADCACDPKYHRRGAGKALLEYGLETAREANVPITLTASPMGRELYLHLNFQELGFFDCGAEGEEEKVRTWVMVWTPEGWKRPSNSNLDIKIEG